MAQAFLRSENLFMRIQYELLKTTSKRTCESYIRNSRQIKNSWKISPYIPPTLKNFDVLVEENWTKRYLGHWPKITTISSHDRVSGWGQSVVPHPTLCTPPPPTERIVDHMWTQSYVSFCVVNSVWKDVKTFSPPSSLCLVLMFFYLAF